MYGSTTVTPCPNCGYNHTYSHTNYVTPYVIVLGGDRQDTTPSYFEPPPPLTKAEARRARSVAAGRESARHMWFAGRAPLVREQYHRPKRKGRACGSAHRVMIP